MQNTHEHLEMPAVSSHDKERGDEREVSEYSQGKCKRVCGNYRRVEEKNGHIQQQQQGCSREEEA